MSPEGDVADEPAADRLNRCQPIAIDVGNTAVKVARWVIVDESIEYHSLDLDDNQLDTRLRESMQSWLEPTASGMPSASNTANRPKREIRVASVNALAAERVQQIVDAFAGPHVQLRRIRLDDVPLQVATETPSKTGIDRVVGAWAAIQLHGAPMVVIDAGTTVTVDLVDPAGVFRGGAILPGLEMQTRALAADTDALPRLDWRSSIRCGEPDSDGPGRDTLGAIRRGILASVAGGIERLVEQYGHAGRVVLTGGDANCLRRQIRLTDLVQSDHLVCRGLLMLP